MGLSKLKQIGSDESGFPILEGNCPVCSKPRLFTNDAYRKAVSLTYGIAKTIVTSITGIANPKYWVDASKTFWGTKTQMKVACEECHHVMWICGKCSAAFSVAPYDHINRCSNCHTENS